MATALLAQSFAGNPLQRSFDLERKTSRFTADILSQPENVELLLTKGRSLCVCQRNQQQNSIAWFQLSELSDHGVITHGGFLSMGGGEHYLQIPPVLLGKEFNTGIWRMALDVSEFPGADKVAASRGAIFQDLRALLPSLAPEDLGIAGQATALLQWHQANQYCGRCGARTSSIEAGAKRQCTSDKAHRAYPRTDPVMITIIESVDGQSALLGRPKSLRSGGVLTCLSGFIEQGESIEEAVRREVKEEAGISVGDVTVLGSQPWPIGRGGSCEIMIGCIGRALGDELHMDGEEMDAVRWISKDDLLKAIQYSSASDSSAGTGRAMQEGVLDFYIPPKWAIAHHLIETWASKHEPWFAKL